MNLYNVEVLGIDHTDMPDYVDAYINYAEDVNGRKLTDYELDVINQDSDLVWDYVMKEIY